MHLKHHGHRLPERDRGERSEQLGVLGLVPLRREPVGSPNEKLFAVELQRLSGLQPGLEGLLRQL